MKSHEMELAIEKLKLVELALEGRKTQEAEVLHWANEQLALADAYQQQIGRYRKIAPVNAIRQFW